MLLVITAQNQFFVVDFTMDAIVDPNSGLASEAALRDTYVAQLEAFMAETRVLTAERVCVHMRNTETEQRPIRGSGGREADMLSGGPWPLRLCSDG